MGESVNCQEGGYSYSFSFSCLYNCVNNKGRKGLTMINRFSLHEHLEDETKQGMDDRFL